MRYIYQIGRLEKNMKPLKFQINSTEVDTYLSSLALKSSSTDVKVILIYPVSLPFNKGLVAEDSSLEKEFKQKIRDILEGSKEDYFKNPWGFFKFHPHTQLVDDFLVVHSFGEFYGQNFEGNFDDIVLEIFIDIVERSLKEPFKELYIDISSGHNIYISAMLEAVRNFVVFYSLSNWINQELKVKLYFSDPIIGSSKNYYCIHKDYELKYKIFFSSIIDEDDINNFSLSRKIFGKEKESRKLKNKLQKFFEEFYLAYSSIKNNTPLVIYSYNFSKEEEIIEMIKILIEQLKEKLFSTWEKSIGINKNDYLKVFLVLAFYIGILRVLSASEINPKYEVSLDEIEENFSKIYDHFNLSLNIYILRHEISNLDRTIENAEKISEGSWIPICQIIAGDGNFHRRNFLAHAGFERTVTEFMKKEQKIYLRYKKEKLKEIFKEGHSKCFQIISK